MPRPASSDPCHKLGCTIPTSLHEAIRSRAERERRPYSAVVQDLLRLGLAAAGRRPTPAAMAAVEG